MKDLLTEKDIHKVFEIGIIIKGIDGVLEILGSILLLSISPQRVGSIIVFLTQHELSEDPRDFLATHLLQTAQEFTSGTKLFQSLYLLTHGVVKIFLVWGLLKNKLWAYPVSIAFLIAFIMYQMYRYSYNHALSLLLLTIFDAIIIGLTWHEYKYVRASRAQK